MLIASPGDVPEEQEIIRQEMFRWNSMHTTEMKMILLPVGWETDAIPDLRERGQAVINRQLVDDCDKIFSAPALARFSTAVMRLFTGSVASVIPRPNSKS